MRWLGIMLIVLSAFSVSARAAREEGIAAHWDFDEGKGDILYDRSGNENHGKIHGATWVKCGKRYVLRFDGRGDYVNCGTGPSLDIRGPISLERNVLSFKIKAETFRAVWIRSEKK